jgi:CDGSH-type Zn-finger protein
MKLKVIANGPIILDTESDVSVTSGDATKVENGPLYLCRCGLSANKPLCDGSHRKAKFEGGAAELVIDS